MNRRQFLSSVAGLGVSAALPTIPVDMPTTSAANDLLAILMKRVMKTEEYQQAQWNLMLYGRSMFDSTKALQQAGLIP